MNEQNSLEEINFTNMTEQLRKVRLTRKKIRLLVSVSMILVFMFYGSLIYSNVGNFDTTTFKKAIEEETIKATPFFSEMFTDIGKVVVPVYEKEINKEYPAFKGKLANVLTMERDILFKNVKNTILKGSKEFVDHIYLKTKDVEKFIDTPKTLDEIGEIMAAVEINLKEYVSIKLEKDMDKHYKELAEIQETLERIAGTTPKNVWNDDEAVLLGVGLKVLGSVVLEEKQ